LMVGDLQAGGPGFDSPCLHPGQRPFPLDGKGASGTPPQRPIEFDALLKDVLSERFPGPRL